MVAVFVVDGGHRCRFLNAVAETLSGASNAQVRGRPVADILWNGNSTSFDDSAIGRTLGGGKGGEGEETLRGHDGVSRQMAFRVCPLGAGVTSGDGAIIELIDLSGETGTSRALRESEQRLRLAVEATGIGIWDVNAVTGERRWSPEMYDILGLPANSPADEEIFSSVIHRDERDKIDEMYRRAYSLPEAAAFEAEFRVLRPSDETERWVAVSGRVSFDASGRPIRGVGTIRDIHERRQFEEALLQSEKRLRIALAAGRMGTWRLDFATGEQQWDPMQYELLGVSPAVRPTRDLFLSLVHPDDLPAVGFDAGSLPPAGTFLDSEFRIVRPDGAIRWITASSLAGYDQSGRPFEMIGINRDITEQKDAEQALRDSEERNRLAIEANHVGTWDYDMVSGAHRWSAIFKKLWGLPVDAPSDPKLLHPLVAQADWDRIRDVWRSGLEPSGTSRLNLEYAIRRADDGALRWCAFTGQIFFDEVTQKPVRALGIMSDVTERRAVEERQRLILREMNHRVKNSLALVQAIISQTIRLTPDPMAAFERIQSRIMALARTHDFLNQDNWAGISLQTLIAGELAPFASEADRVHLEGDQVLLDSSSMFALGLTFHELAANALKHGALSVPDGRVDVSWRIIEGEGGRQVEVTWRERGGPPADHPAEPGFGSRLIGANVRATLGGTVEVRYGRAGLRCTLTFPLRPLVVEDSFPEQNAGSARHLG